VDEPYRSYVVRVHRPAGRLPVVRLDVEDLQGGRRVAVHGAVARRVAQLLVRMLSAGSPDPPT
jgi:hypothetical protein